MMKPKITVKNKEHLKKINRKKICISGNECDLNHLDISNIEDFNYLFESSQFNGDISD